MQKRFWSQHRPAVLLSLAILAIGLIAIPWPWAFLLALLPLSLSLTTHRNQIIEEKTQDDVQIPTQTHEELEDPSLRPASKAQIDLEEPEVSSPDPSAPLIGTLLLNKVKELGDVGKSEIVRACGYVSIKKDGGERLNFTAFYEALLDAKGVQLSPPNQEVSSDEDNEGEEDLDYRLTTALDGSLLFTSSYTRLLDLLPGDEFDAILFHDSIGLLPCGGEWDEELSEEFSQTGTNRTWPVTVDSQNNIPIPPDALSALGVNPGQQFTVRLGRKAIKLELTEKRARTYDISNLTTIEKRVLAETPTTEAGILNQLLNDSNSYVQAAARRTLNGENNISQTRPPDATSNEDDDLPDDWHGLNNDALVLRIQNTDQIPLETLEVLASKNYWRVREAVAVHPSTPASLLGKLAEDSDSDVQAALSRRHFPAPWGQLTRDALLDCLRKQPAPLQVLADLAKSQSGFVRAAVAANPETTADILESLAGDSFGDVRRAVACAENTPSSVVEAMAMDEDSEVRNAIALRRMPVEWRQLDDDESIKKLAEPSAPPEVLEVLSHSGSWTIRQAVARNRSVEEEILNRLKDDDDSDVAAAARDGLLNRKLPEEWRLLDDSDRIDRLKEGTVPVDVLELLAISANWRIRQAVARHEGTPDAVLNQLADDDYSDVRQAIEDRRLPVEWRHLDEDERIEKLAEPVAPPEVLEVLSHSGSWTIRQAVARNRSVGEEILNRLKDDDDSDVASAARDGLLNRKLPQEWRLLDDSDRIDRLKESAVQVEVLELLAISANWRVRQAVARHEGTPDAVLNQLADDDDSDVKQAIEDRRLPVEWRHLDEDERINTIRSTSVDLEVLETLSKSPSWRVRQAVASTTRTPLVVLEQLSRDRYSEVQRSAKDSLVQTQLPEEWKQLSEMQKIKRLKSSHAPSEVLDLLALSSSIEIRDAVAMNSNASIAILLKMKQDTSTGSRIQRLVRHSWAMPQSGWQPKYPDEQS